MACDTGQVYRSLLVNGTDGQLQHSQFINLLSIQQKGREREPPTPHLKPAAFIITHPHHLPALTWRRTNSCFTRKQLKHRESLLLFFFTGLSIVDASLLGRFYLGVISL